MRDPAPDTFKGIHMAQEAQDREPMSTGWIFAAGPQAHLQGTYPWNPEPLAPEFLIGMHIYFGMSVGKPVRLDISDNKWNGSFLIMTPRDIYSFDEAPWDAPWDMV
ncbi:unnamed protein product [marine sediment metagenome]|uniref:Uncharacterized protein n=1 Tax=marine sediment metagenome TaxID=412755 RepID=X0S9R6_9ZZZZ